MEPARGEELSELGSKLARGRRSTHRLSKRLFLRLHDDEPFTLELYLERFA